MAEYYIFLPCSYPFPGIYFRCMYFCHISSDWTSLPFLLAICFVALCFPGQQYNLYIEQSTLQGCGEFHPEIVQTIIEDGMLHMLRCNPSTLLVPRCVPSSWRLSMFKNLIMVEMHTWPLPPPFP